MTKKILILTMLLCLIGFTVACNDDGISNNGTKKDLILQSEETLVGTSWKLVGFFDAEKNELTKVEPKPSEEFYSEGNYILNFNTDSTVSGYTVLNTTMGEYNIDYSLSILEFTRFASVTFAAELFDSNLYVELMNKVKSFSSTEAELKLFYNDKKNYLFFERRR